MPALIKTLNDENKTVREMAASALKQLGTPEAKKAVERWGNNQ
ncbi:HEAT repeat domain-containing protein [Candidatus Poribacteria bacterium]|nr:HEAT repeat domain-containing protein [Candidatus Poribacteria bacterium]